MKVPTIFHWPSPWLWGAIGVLILVNANRFFDVIQGAAVLTFIASVVFYVQGRFNRRSDSGAASTHSGHTADRLDAIERRLTDTQDVMIALSEKVDQWETERKQAAGAETTL